MNKQHYYLAITELIIPETAPYEETHAAINRFIDGIPILVKKIEDIRESGRFSDNSSELVDIINQTLPLISDVNAKVLEMDAKLIMRRIERTGYPSGLLIAFTSNLMALSLKIQRAQNFGEEIEHARKMEDHLEIIHALSSFLTLLILGNYKEAHNMLNEIMVFDEDTLFVFDKLIGLLLTQQYEEAKSVALDLKEKHNKAIEQSVGKSFVLKILAVDDMPESLSFIGNALKDHYKIFRATNGKTALKIIQTHNIDLFVLDIDMPEMDGYELATKIRSTSGYAKTPIIFLTGNSTREHISKAIQVGGNDFIVKPVSYETLLQSINKHIFTPELINKNMIRFRQIFQGYKVLLAEGVKINREIIMALLEPTLMKVDCAVNGSEAVNIFKLSPEEYDLILMDVQLSEVDGYEVTRSIRAMGPGKAKNIPIIAMTANASHQDVEKCLEAGMNGHINKPIEIEEFIGTLQEYLTRK